VHNTSHQRGITKRKGSSDNSDNPFLPKIKFHLLYSNSTLFFKSVTVFYYQHIHTFWKLWHIHLIIINSFYCWNWRSIYNSSGEIQQLESIGFWIWCKQFNIQQRTNGVRICAIERFENFRDSMPVNELLLWVVISNPKNILASIRHT